MQVYQIQDEPHYWDGANWKPIQVGDKFKKWNGFHWCFYEVLELEPHRFGKHRTGFRLEQDELFPFWVSDSELSSYEPATTVTNMVFDTTKITQVFVVLFVHEHGEDITVVASKEKANAVAIEIMRSNLEDLSEVINLVGKTIVVAKDYSKLEQMLSARDAVANADVIIELHNKIYAACMRPRQRHRILIKTTKLK